MVGVELAAGTTFSRPSSTASGSRPGARPVRFETRKMWVSTAMVGSLEGDVEDDVRRLAADAGQRLQLLAGARHRAAEFLDQFS